MARVEPVILGWKVNDVSQLGRWSVVVSESTTKLQLARIAGCFVGDEVIWEPFFEFESDTLAHDANTVDRADDRFDS